MTPSSRRSWELTEQESAVLNKITEAWNAFVALPRCHPMEIQEGCTFVHGLQSLVMVRVAVRSDPGRFTHLPEFPLTDEVECPHERISDGKPTLSPAEEETNGLP